MRPLWKDVLTAVWLGMILPGIVLNAFVIKERNREIQQVPPSENPSLEYTGYLIPVCNFEGICTNMELEDYLTGVLLAEMPAEFHSEALKAQSVAARTYTWKGYTTGGKHGNGSVCTDSACFQGYVSEEEYLSRGGTLENLTKVRQAVKATSCMVLFYDSELIEATYFSSSGGSTEAAAAVWGADYPYLQSVSSPEENQFVEVVSFTAAEFQHLIGKKCYGEPMDWFGTVSYTEGGGVLSMEICGESYSGVQLRTLLNLRSTAFQVAADDRTVTVTTRGYGHRVGMSQYGANTMAENGCTWQKILQHYYPGTTIAPIC